MWLVVWWCELKQSPSIVRLMLMLAIPRNLSIWSGQLSLVYTLLSTLLFLVVDTFAEELIGGASICEILKTKVILLEMTVVSDCWCRSRHETSVCAFVGLNSISYWLVYRNLNSHCCSLVAAKEGIPLIGPRIAISALWSFEKKFLP